MRYFRFVIGLAALAVSAQALPAQQPTHPSPDARRSGGMAGMMDMQRMDSLDGRLDSLTSRMNRAAGNQKVAAMAAVINELVAQRRAMREHMHQMMESRGMMMKPERRPAAAQPALPRDSTASDSTGHAEHHPSQ